MKSIYVIFISLLLFSCDNSGIGEVKNYFVEGENAFIAGDYSLAIEKFIDEIDRDKEETALEARVGLAWSYFRNGDFVNTKLALTDLYNFDQSSQDYYAISTLIAYTEDDDSEIEINALTVLGIDENYFSNPSNIIVDKSYELFLDDEVNFEDIALTYAISLFKQKKYNYCHTIVLGFLDFQWNPPFPGDLEFSLMTKLQQLSNELN